MKIIWGHFDSGDPKRYKTILSTPIDGRIRKIRTEYEDKMGPISLDYGEGNFEYGLFYDFYDKWTKAVTMLSFGRSSDEIVKESLRLYRHIFAYVRRYKVCK